MGNSERGPKCHHSQTPMTPPMWDADGQNRTRVGTVVAQGQGWTASRNSIGHIAKVERGRRVTGRVKARSTVRVEGGPRVASMMGIGSVINTNPVDQEFGHHSMNERCPISPISTAQKDVWGTRHSVPSNDLSKLLKLKDEVIKNAQSYIRRRATIIFRTLSPDHEAVKCLSAFGDQAQKFAAEVFAIIEWGTQYWKLQETFPVPVIPRWL